MGTEVRVEVQAKARATGIHTDACGVGGSGSGGGGGSRFGVMCACERVCGWTYKAPLDLGPGGLLLQPIPQGHVERVEVEGYLLLRLRVAHTHGRLLHAAATLPSLEPVLTGVLLQEGGRLRGYSGDPAHRAEHKGEVPRGARPRFVS
jgi:hypothetical protein